MCLEQARLPEGSNFLIRLDALMVGIGRFPILGAMANSYSLCQRTYALFVRCKIIPETLKLVHAFVQDGDDPDVAVRQIAPIDKMPFVSKVEPLDAKLCGNGL